MSSLKNEINQSIFNKEPFWGAYVDLNQVVTPSEQAIQNYQLQKLKALCNNIVKKNNSAQKINELFVNGAINTLPSQAQNDQEIQLNEAITNIVNNISEFRDLTKWHKQKKNLRRYVQAQEKLKELSSYLAYLKQKVNINSPVFDADLERLNNLIAENSLKSFGQASMSSWISDLNKIQGELVEEIGTAWLAERIPTDIEILPVSTGKIYYSGGRFGTRGQLIQDILMLNISNIDLLNDLEISYKQGDKEYTTTLGNFLNVVIRSNDSKQIKIDDALYGLLLEMSDLNIQSKSGKNQLPWNTKSKNTHVSIGEFANNDGLTISVLRTFSLLHSLDLETPKDQWVSDSSFDYNALANYGLATVFHKILHLSEMGNQYLLTPSGFIDYPTRLQQLFESRQSSVRIQGKVTINENTLGHPYAVNMKANWY